MESNLKNGHLETDVYIDASGAYAHLITVYIVLAVIFAVIGIIGAIIVCICGRPKTTLGFVHNRPAIYQVQSVVPVVPNVMPLGTCITNQEPYKNTHLPSGADMTEKGSAPPRYEEATGTFAVNPTYH